MATTVEVNVEVAEVLGQISVEDVADFYGDELVQYIKEENNLEEA